MRSPPHGHQQLQSARVVAHARANGGLLKQQDRIEFGKLVAEEISNPPQRHPQTLQGEHLVKADHLVGSIGSPSGAGAQRIHQAEGLVKAQGLGADLEPFCRLGGAEETWVHKQSLSSTHGCFECVPRAGSRDFLSVAELALHSDAGRA
jgi:hypothetical protein